MLLGGQEKQKELEWGSHSGFKGRKEGKELQGLPTVRARLQAEVGGGRKGEAGLHPSGKEQPSSWDKGKKT